jgi:CRISPR-associated endonuclease Csy4
MNSYIDLKLLPDTEFRATILMNAVYTKLHKALHELSSTGIGVSFPQYRVTLGDVLRLHGTSESLEKLQHKSWLGGMAGYCSVSEVLPVPANSQHRVVSRVQTNMSQSKLNRLIKRRKISADAVKGYKAKMFSQRLENAYLELKSSSNRHHHRRYIQFGNLVDQPVEGGFDYFGLSKIATVPWF